MSRLKSAKQIIEILRVHVESIRFGKGHYVCTLKTGKKIAISSSPSDGYFNRQVYRQFRQAGIDIPELKNIHA